MNRRRLTLFCCLFALVALAGCSEKRHPDKALGQKSVIDLGFDDPMR